MPKTKSKNRHHTSKKRLLPRFVRVLVALRQVSGPGSERTFGDASMHDASFFVLCAVDAENTACRAILPLK